MRQSERHSIHSTPVPVRASLHILNAGARLEAIEENGRFRLVDGLVQKAEAPRPNPGEGSDAPKTGKATVHDIGDFSAFEQDEEELSLGLDDDVLWEGMDDEDDDYY